MSCKKSYEHNGRHNREMKLITSLVESNTSICFLGIPMLRMVISIISDSPLVTLIDAVDISILFGYDEIHPLHLHR